jgi:hypothetical protein
MNATWRIIGGSINGLKPYGDMAALVIGKKGIAPPQER